jgi:hypothetical protein
MGAGKLIKLTWTDGPDQTTETVTGFNEVGETNWREYSFGVTGFGTVDRAKAYWRRTGPDVLIRGQFRTGTPAAETAKMRLPEELFSILDMGKTDLSVYNYEMIGRGAMSRNASELGLIGRRNNRDVFFTALVTGYSGMSSADGNQLATASGQTIMFSGKIPINGFEF